MEINAEIILLDVSVILAVIVLFYALRTLLLLKDIPADVIRAKAFLTEPFLRRIILMVFAICIMMALHAIFEFAELGYTPDYVMYLLTKIHILGTFTLLSSMAILLNLVYYIFKLLSSSRK